MKKFKPITPSKRHHIDIDRRMLSKEEPYKPLTKFVFRSVGRNNRGRITMRHKGSGHKRLYRTIDFAQSKFGVPGVVETIEYDPNRTCFIALVLYKDGSRRYILAPHGIKAGDSILCDDKAELNPGSRMRLKNIPIGTIVHNIEIKPGEGGKIGRAAGSGVSVFGQEGNYTYLKMPSTEVRKVTSESFASIGNLSNPEHSLISVGKAGRSRNKGIRPHVRGSAMNAVDHPYGGGEGKAPRGTKRPKDKWGNITGGRKTRSKSKYSDKLIISRRKTKKR